MTPDGPSGRVAPSAKRPAAREIQFPIDDSARVPEFRRALLEFYRDAARDLPWREATDPYGVLVSEFMLQQTRVQTVLPYFARWMERFPDVRSLAAAPVDEVLSIWAGLGYYSRARNLHRAARQIVETNGGAIPGDSGTLRTLPGVGEYTAAAVASIAFGEPVAAVDGNVRRVLARLTDDADPAPARLATRAAILVDGDDPGTFNQAMMELGALICTPKAPQCERCPVASFCAARRAGTQAERPAPRARAAAPGLREAVAALVRWTGPDFELLLRRRPEQGLLGGLWELPGVEVAGRERPSGAARRLASGLVGFRSDRAGRADLPAGQRLEPLEHRFTHRRIRYLPYLFRVEAYAADPGTEDSLRWVAREGADALPLPTAQRTLVARVSAALAA